MLTIYSLAPLNAALNALSGIFLVTGFFMIRRGRVHAHQWCMQSAFVTSIVFLISYLYYHYNVGSVPFTGEGWTRPVYFTLLISHTVLAALVPPLALITLYRAWKRQFQRHRRIARWTFPVWLYVSVTGVLVYLILYQFFPNG